MATTTRTYTATRAQLQTKFDAHGTNPIKVLLASGYTFNEDHETVDDITGEITTGSVTRLTLSSVTSVAADGVWTGDAADPTWTGVTFTDADTLIVFADEGADSASPLLGCIDFPPTDVTADDFTVAFNAKGIFVVSAASQTGLTAVEPLAIGGDNNDELALQFDPGTLDVVDGALTVIGGGGSEPVFVLGNYPGDLSHGDRAWTTPVPASTWTTGYDFRLPIWPITDGGYGDNTFTELGGQIRDGGIGDIDNVEPAVLWMGGEPYLYLEWTQTGGASEVYPIACYPPYFSGYGWTDTGWRLPKGRRTLVRFTLMFDDGAGNWRAEFWREALAEETPDDTTTDGTRWMREFEVTAGDATTIPGTTDIDPGVTEPLGAGYGRGLAFCGAQEWYDGVDGTVFASPDPADAIGVTSFTDGQGNVWTAGDHAVALPLADAVAMAAAFADALKAPLASPALTGNPTAPTQSAGNNSTRLATTAYTDAAVAALVLPWVDHVNIVGNIRRPDTVTGTWTAIVASALGGGYCVSATTNDQSYTYARLPLRAGTYTLRSVNRTTSSAGILTFTLGGSSIGTVDTYSAGDVNDVTNPLTGITVSTSGFYDLVITNTTKNASSSAYGMWIQVLDLYRTGP